MNMKHIKLKENIYWIGSVDHSLREFDVVLNAEYGTTYNSYLVIGSEKTAIIDTVKHTKVEDYLKKHSGYETPEVVSVEPSKVSKPYLDWIRSETKT